MDTELDVNETLIVLTADIVAAHVSHNSVAVSDIPQLISSVHESLSLASKGEPVEAIPEPAVPIKSSVKHDYIVCLEDGKKLKMLKRHLNTHYGLSPDEYRQRWGLPADYPMTAPGYAEERRKIAKDIGLGRKSED